MATLLYIIAHQISPLNDFAYDRIIVCMLIALEFPQYLRLWVWWLANKR